MPCLSSGCIQRPDTFRINDGDIGKRIFLQREIRHFSQSPSYDFISQEILIVALFDHNLITLKTTLRACIQEALDTAVMRGVIQITGNSKDPVLFPESGQKHVGCDPAASVQVLTDKA